MKKIITTIALCAFMTPALAENVTAKELCPMLGQLAGEIMKARQNGIPLSHSYELAAESEIAMGMVELAYNETRMHSEGGKERAVQDFQEAWEIACYEQDGELL